MNIEEIKAREQAASGENWTVGTVAEKCDFEILEPGADRVFIAEVYYHDDAVFIAHARTDIPALISEVERLTKENDLISSLANGYGYMVYKNSKSFDELLDKKKMLQAENASLKKALILARDPGFLRRISSGEFAPIIHAYWNYTSVPNEDGMGGSHNVIKCSACKENCDAEHDYCPFCGARMDGKDDEYA